MDSSCVQIISEGLFLLHEAKFVRKSAIKIVRKPWKTSIISFLEKSPEMLSENCQKNLFQKNSENWSRKISKQ